MPSSVPSAAPPAIARLPLPPGAAAFLAVDKPAGIAVQGPGGLLSLLRAREGEGLALVHRLDRDTSGVLLLARTPEALALAHAAWPNDVTKSYVARTRGVPAEAEGTIDARLLENRTSRPDLLRRGLRAAYGPSRAGHLLAGRRVLAIPPIPPPGRTAVHPGGRPASTHWRVLSSANGRALVELQPATGRMHQLRVHLAHLGTPVLGDPFYDPLATEPGTPPMLLHAIRLVWANPPGGGAAWRIESPLPRAARDGG